MKINRKHFLKATALLLLAYPLKLLFDAGESSVETTKRNRSRVLPLDLPEGISFHDDIIAVHNGDSFRFFSARCPHLGCRINQLENSELVCPCHGSRFSTDGQVIQGPATGSLTELTYTKNTAKRQIAVNLFD